MNLILLNDISLFLEIFDIIIIEVLPHMIFHLNIMPTNVNTVSIA